VGVGVELAVGVSSGGAVVGVSLGLGSPVVAVGEGAPGVVVAVRLAVADGAVGETEAV
jgi:hypothetical protein